MSHVGDVEVLRNEGTWNMSRVVIDSPLAGTSVLRSEDRSLLTGSALYAGDLQLEGLLHASIVRSPIAHATIRRIDTSAAVDAPGVVAVFSSDNLPLEPMPLTPMVTEAPASWQRAVLAEGVVRFVGEMVALVVADSAVHAADAAELVEVDYDSLPAVIDLEEAVTPGAPPLYAELGTNVVVDIPFEGGTRVDGARTRGVVSVATRIVNPRMAVVPMETNAVTVVPDDAGERITVWASTQFPHWLRAYIARTLRTDLENIRVACKAVGGGFGGKGAAEPEYALIAAAARALRRPVQYVETRTENLVTMHGRGHVFNVRLDAADDGIVTDLAVDMLTDAGAYPDMACAMPLMTRSLAAGPYLVPHLTFRIRCASTNTAPVGAFRGAGRPEAAALLERTLDVLAQRLGIDPVELRRRNLIPRDRFPYTTPTGAEYDSGDYEACLDTALDLAGYADLRREQRDRRVSASRALLGVGVCCYVELSAGGIMADEFGSVRVNHDGVVEVLVGTSAHGQGHATVFAQIVSDVLGVAFEHVSVIDSDTDVVPSGKGTASSRSVQTAGSAVKTAADAVLEKARELAAAELEAALEDIVVVPGTGLGVAGVPSAVVTWARLAALADDPGRVPTGMTPGLVAAPGFCQDGGTAPSGCHVAVVEVDHDTGVVEIVRMVAVDDCGTVVNPMLAEGQVHGGVAAGIGEALFEEMRYDVDGNPLTAYLADYAMPSAADLPSIDAAFNCTPTPKNPLGAKGIGEAGTCGALAAVHNAVIDAVAHLGVEHIDLPLTPQRVWEAISRATNGDKA